MWTLEHFREQSDLSELCVCVFNEIGESTPDFGRVTIIKAVTVNSSRGFDVQKDAFDIIMQMQMRAYVEKASVAYMPIESHYQRFFLGMCSAS